MPNHVANKFIASGNEQDLKKLFNIFSDDGSVTFNKIIPMPDELQIDSCSSGDWAVKILTSKGFHDVSHLNSPPLTKWCAENGITRISDLIKALETSPPKGLGININLGKKYLLNIANYGCRTWYEWCPEN